ncbi:endonuclease [Marinifilum caeruleilacunae]|uniref:T9SS type A sorting domain-containing protein n=1 Tax=Marinifilum caeruleilacunae TaxID=2499076 RepID=A0ABX1X0J7_9BACT|nr:endonuclease [Marinifilum caeruleilacunae]NOU61681.1 T9SS type A sorting domain-containing protein [Marinifilum caeruleilacunae]
MTKLLRVKSLFILHALLLWSSILFAQVSVDEYYQSATGKTGGELKFALYEIIKEQTVIPYTTKQAGDEYNVWEALKEADQDPANADNVILIYTGRSEAKSSSDWNREHIWAKSYGLGDPYDDPGAATDVHALRPCDGSVNTDRSNKFFDNGGTPHDEATECKYDDDSWEPRDEVKGDIARIIFYMAVRYKGENGEPNLSVTDDMADYRSGKPVHGKLSSLIEWNTQDPVDDAERARNEKIYEIQGNRNPFVDHPEWVNIWTGTDSSSPIFNDLLPENGATSVSLTSNLTISFNEEVKEGMGTVRIYNYDSDVEFESLDVTSNRVTFSGNKVRINPEAMLEEGVKYYVLIDNGAITDAYSNTYDGITDKEFWTFTATYTAPDLVDFSPEDDSNGISISTDLELTFDKDVQAGDGNIDVYNNSGLVESISASSSDVTFNGDMVSVDITDDLEGATEYYILIDDNAFISANGVAYEGISDNTAWTFTSEVITGIDDLYAKGVPSFYPNPATREIKLTNMDKVVSIHITNLTGRNIMEVKSPDTRISIANLPKGMYFVTFISNDGNRVTKKLLKR